MAFKGWPDTALAFYEGLEADNSKAYWLDHKEVYERDVKAPMDALLAELTGEFGESKLFRPYRDTRFSAATSRRTRLPSPRGSATGTSSSRPKGSSPAPGCTTCCPTSSLASATRSRPRSPATKLEGVVAALTKRGLNVHAMEELKTAPRGYPKEHPRIELLAHEGPGRVAVWEPTAWLATAAAKKRVVDVLRATKPLLAVARRQRRPVGRSRSLRPEPID